VFNQPNALRTVKIKRNSNYLGITSESLVVDCRQQRLSRCQRYGNQTLIVISNHSHQLRWCSHRVSRLMLTSFDQGKDNPARSRYDINKWVDNGSVQVNETSERTFIITF
jgi:hypothetical protein